MPNCCAVFCKNKQHAGCGKTFHRFPPDNSELQKKWLVNIRREKWHPKKNTVICSDHFQESCFDRTGQTVRLREGTVPTIFQFPAHLQKGEKKRKAPLKRSPMKAVSNQIQQEAIDFSRDHNYFTSPSKLKRKLDERCKENVRIRKKLRTCKQKVYRLRKKVHAMEDVIHALRKENLLTESGTEILKKSFAGAPLALFTRMLKNKESDKRSFSTYAPALRSFALTLQFYSARAYDFVRKTFDLALPSPSTIRSWYSKISGEPGFTEQSFIALQAQADAAKAQNETLICSLIIDEMSIRKHVEWDGRRFKGYVDMGADIDDDDLPLASEALVFMVVSLTKSWKLPVAYFLIGGLTGEERANLVKECLIRLQKINVCITSVTFDGPSCHFSMAKCLGVELKPPTSNTWFPHPSNNELKVYVVLDICHMIKLIRNALSTLKAFKNNQGQEIKWMYVTALQNLQDDQGLHLGTRLKKAHVQWQSQKMKVNLAAQTLSSSVADAIEFCMKDLNLPEFEGASATIDFIRKVDQLFDILNSRNPCAKGFKAPLKKFNEYHWRPFLQKILIYLDGLTAIDGQKMFETKRKTGFVGFYVSTVSILGIFNDYVSSPKPCLRYLLTYKFSQDHLELFFSAVRARGGFNNNPTASQFCIAYKRLLMRHSVESSGGNVIKDATKVLSVEAINVQGTPKQSTDLLDISLIRRYDLEFKPEPQVDHDYANIPDPDRLTLYVENVVGYIAGYVVRMVGRKISCLECLGALESKNSSASCLSLLNRKSNGGLKIPSNDVICICELTERYIRRMMKSYYGDLPKTRNFGLILCTAVLQEVYDKPTQIFKQLDEHMLDSTIESNHVYRLIKVISESFIKIRMHHLAKKKTEKMTGCNIRKKLSRVIIFKHQ